MPSPSRGEHIEALRIAISSKTESSSSDLHPACDFFAGCGVMSGDGASLDLGGRGVANGLSSLGLDPFVVEEDVEAVGRLGVEDLVVMIVVDFVVIFVVVVVTVVMGCGWAR